MFGGVVAPLRRILVSTARETFDVIVRWRTTPLETCCASEARSVAISCAWFHGPGFWAFGRNTVSAVR
jgi:hypothetical protein